MKLTAGATNVSKILKLKSFSTKRVVANGLSVLSERYSTTFISEMRFSLTILRLESSTFVGC